MRSRRWYSPYIDDSAGVARRFTVVSTPSVPEHQFSSAVRGAPVASEWALSANCIRSRGAYEVAPAPLGGVVHCPVCGGTVADDAAHCHFCGRSLRRKEEVGNTVEARATPELSDRVRFGFVVRRTTAAILDLAFAFLLAYSFSRGRNVGFSVALLGTAKLGMVVLTPLAYFLFRDAIGGKSLGKLLLRLTVADIVTLSPIGFAASISRNGFIVPGALLLVLALSTFKSRLAFGLPLVWIAIVLLVPFALPILLGRRRRPGDGFAGTFVTDDRELR